MSLSIKAAAEAYKDKCVKGWKPHEFKQEYWERLLRMWMVVAFRAGALWERRRVRND